MGFVECGQKPPEEECPENFFHCVVSKACVPIESLCDLNDDCGDNSDEETETCQGIKIESFEQDDNPLGIFVQNADHADFEWERGSGVIEGDFVTGPPFDHTTFSSDGHYLFIRVSTKLGLFEFKDLTFKNKL